MSRIRHFFLLLPTGPNANASSMWQAMNNLVSEMKMIEEDMRTLQAERLAHPDVTSEVCRL